MNALDGFVAAAQTRVEDGAYDLTDTALRPHGPLRLHEKVLAEAKRGSPTRGDLDVDAHSLLRAYRRARPMGVSILTAGGPFQGAPQHLRQAHPFGMPTMMKDFIVDERQVRFAAHAGASAVLLIERVVGARRDAFIRLAHGLGLQVVLEIDHPSMVDGALESHADVIGVNARDLDTLETDPARADAMVRTLRDRHPRCPVLRLSGIGDAHDARNAMANGADGVLVGTALTTSDEPSLLLAAMKGPLVKVCGLRPGDLDMARGADMVGMVVASGGPRDVDPGDARTMAAALRARHQTSVLVTRTDPEHALRLAIRIGPDVLQLHHACNVDALRTRLRPYGIGLLPATIHPSAPFPHLLDADPAGGSGTTLAPRPAEDSLLIAGGLDADNVGAMLHATGALGADASSGLESGPGRKSAAKVRAFIDAVRASATSAQAPRGLLHA